MKKKLVLAMAATMAITSCAVPVLADDAAAVLIWKNSLKQLDMMWS